MSNAQTQADFQADFFATPIRLMIQPNHPLVVLASRLPWDEIEAALKPSLARQAREGRVSVVTDLLGTHDVIIHAGLSPAGRPRLNTRLMVSLLYLKHAFNHSDESLVEEWSQNIVWQHFSGMVHLCSTARPAMPHKWDAFGEPWAKQA